MISLAVLNDYISYSAESSKYSFTSDIAYNIDNENSSALAFNNFLQIITAILHTSSESITKESKLNGLQYS